MNDQPLSQLERVCRVVVRGRVQRVGYRNWTETRALARGLSGWVRNRADGTVEAVFAGASGAVDAMVAACRNGPPNAQVEAVETRDGGAGDLALRRSGELFSVLPNA
jgi:acylphosphatase